jgi:D-serine dehydratase
MLVQLEAGLDTPTSVYDIGLDNKTEADGLAVAQASMLVAPIMKRILSGIFLVRDETLLQDTFLASQSEGISIEPSAAAAFRGPAWLQHSESGRRYLASHHLADRMPASNHVLWSTGGALMPAEEHARFQARGRALSFPAFPVQPPSTDGVTQ